MSPRHVLLVTFPAQGHINPSLQFAKRLVNMGIEVTFATSVYAQRRMEETADGDLPKGLKFTPYSDGYDDGFTFSDDGKKYMMEIRSRASKTLKDTVMAAAKRGRPISCFIHTLLLPWVSKVAREVHIPSALLWIQSATVFNAYYYYFNGYGDQIKAQSNDPTWKIQLPGIPILLSKHDIPSFMLATSSERYSYALTSFNEQLEVLDVETKPKVLVNTFDSLEPDVLMSIDKYELIGVGPLIPSAFLDGKDPLDTSFGGDLFQKSDDYIEWLESKPKSSVVYVSFGSLLSLPKSQMEEIAKGLLDSGRPFLWVRRVNEKAKEEKKEENENLSCMEELEKVGRIVSWCSQLEVLTHPSLGCFMTHCGWNSTLESISCGVPVVAFPHWTDQGTNAKLIEDVWKTGVRVRANEDGVVECAEIRRCIEEVMDGGEKSIELRHNAEKWKSLAGEAMEENGSSNMNLKAFLEEVGAGCHSFF
ncbi:crocetin glucosyltransferase, chloroplastic-like [Sesamum indicum]|uniref:Glycosyltransferase n=1 Tax=Sesamum indicum TaxID=4182 RepID=A0A6I9TAK2_SESIN|nr:crocetin glucosyltransferase, chloroplastic-like [Sesamum indicum]